MELGLRRRVAVVCAASQGLGLAAAIGFAREGAHVVICSRDAKKLSGAARQVRAAAAGGARVLAVTADLTKAAHIRKLFRSALREFKRIDVLVTNAGGPPVAAFPDLDDTTWRKGIDLNLMSTIRCIREALPAMQKRKWGRIINITSFAAKQPVDDLVISSTVRPGILGLSKVLANRYSREGITINSVAPGFIRTARQEEIGAVRAKAAGTTVDKYIAKMGEGIPAGRFGTPEELANVIVFLGSERAAYISGTTVNVDGGLMKGII